MKPGEFEQYGHGTNFPHPLFIFCGPGYIKILHPDEMSIELEDRHRWERHLQGLALYVKVTGVSELFQVWPKYVAADEPDEPGLVYFPDMDSGERVQHFEQDLFLVSMWPDDWAADCAAE